MSRIATPALVLGSLVFLVGALVGLTVVAAVTAGTRGEL